MIYLKNGHSIDILNANALTSRCHISYADVTAGALDAASNIVSSSAATYAATSYTGSGTRNVRLVTVSNDGVAAGTFGIFHNNGTFSAPIGKAILQPGQILLYNEASGVQVSSAESSTLATVILPNTASPAIPAADFGTIFMKKLGGRMMAAQIGPSGLDTTFQPNLGGNKVALWMPPGNTTIPGVFGMQPLTVTGTATARAVSTTNVLTRMSRYGVNSAATAAAVCGLREAQVKYTTGAGGGLGGFYARYRFGVADVAVVAGARMFIGLDVLTAAPTNIEPSTKVNCIGVGKLSTSDNLHIIFGNATAKTPIDLGVNFPAHTNVAAYELTLFAPTDGGCSYQVTRLNTSYTASGSIAQADLPLSTSMLCHQMWRTNNATALAVALDVCGIYIETDY